MKPTHINSQFVIFDDVLPAEAFRRFWKMYLNTSFRSVHDRAVSGYYRPTDGHPMIGPSVGWTTRDLAHLLPDGIRADELPVRFFPTHEAYDDVIGVLREVCGRYPVLLGKQDEDWIGVLARMQGYPTGTSIAWHTDDTDVTGSFIYYAHPYWDVHWGGELFIADASSHHCLTRKTALHEFDGRFETEALMRAGIGHYVMPKPNRLILVAEGNAHKVAKVAPAAGDHVRATFSGFFMRPAGVAGMIRQALAAASGA